MHGHLLDLGNYRGLPQSRACGSSVRGELYACEDSSKTLHRLDKQEGCGSNDPEPRELERREMKVGTEKGTDCVAWVYVYKGPIDQKRQIHSASPDQHPLR